MAYSVAFPVDQTKDTTAFAFDAHVQEISRIYGLINNNINLGGVPTAPTASVASRTSTTQIATTEFVFGMVQASLGDIEFYWAGNGTNGTSATKVVPSWANTMYVSASGAGGGGSAAGPGGGGGASCKFSKFTISAGDTITVVIGGGGAGSASTASANDPATYHGANGGDTAWAKNGTAGSTYNVTYAGGKGGGTNTAVASLGGAGGAAGSYYGGSDGGVRQMEYLGNTTASATAWTTVWSGGRGGDSTWGAGGAGGCFADGTRSGVTISAGNTGKNGIGFGGGGGGGGTAFTGATSTWTNTIGGNGAPGCMAIRFAYE